MTGKTGIAPAFDRDNRLRSTEAQRSWMIWFVVI